MKVKRSQRLVQYVVATPCQTAFDDAFLSLVGFEAAAHATRNSTLLGKVVTVTRTCPEGSAKQGTCNGTHQGASVKAGEHKGEAKQ